MTLFNNSTTFPRFGSGVAEGVTGVEVHIVAVMVWITAVDAAESTPPVGGKHANNKIIGAKGKRRFNTDYLPICFILLYSNQIPRVNNALHTIAILLGTERKSKLSASQK
jgi:hypothetical protein